MMYQWISINDHDKLPKKSGKVSVLIKHGLVPNAIQNAHYYKDENKFIVDGKQYNYYDITHWMPLIQQPIANTMEQNTIKEKSTYTKKINWNNGEFGTFEALIVDGKLTDFMACERKDVATIYSNNIDFLKNVRDSINDILKEIDNK